MYVRAAHTVYLQILAVIKFGDLPEIRQKCIIGGILLWRFVTLHHCIDIIHTYVCTAHTYYAHTVYLEILAVIKFGNLPEIWQKCIIGGI